MPTKRKSDAMEPTILGPLDASALNTPESDGGVPGTRKKTHISNTLDASLDVSSEPKTWRDIKLEGEDGV